MIHTWTFNAHSYQCIPHVIRDDSWCTGCWIEVLEEDLERISIRRIPAYITEEKNPSAALASTLDYLIDNFMIERLGG